MSRMMVMRFTARAPKWFRKMVTYYKWDSAEWDWLTSFGQSNLWVRK